MRDAAKRPTTPGGKVLETATIGIGIPIDSIKGNNSHSFRLQHLFRSITIPTLSPRPFTITPG
jgi:hypothetical protein